MRFERRVAHMIRCNDIRSAVDELEKRALESPTMAPSHANYLAICKAKLGDLEAARDLLRVALSESPRDPKIANNLGNVELLLGDPDLALKMYRKACLRDPFSPEPRYNMCLAYLQLGQFEKALLAFKNYETLCHLSANGKFIFFVAIAILLVLSLYLRFAD